MKTLTRLALLAAVLAWGGLAHAAACVPAPGTCGCVDVPCDQNLWNCWETKFQVGGTTANVCTQFGCRVIPVDWGKRLCTPSPDDPAKHLEMFLTEFAGFPKPAASSAAPIKVNVPGVNNLTLTDVGAPKYLVVRANKSLAGFPAVPGAQPAHLCYRTTQAGDTRITMDVTDQFGTPSVDIRDALFLCYPATVDTGVIPAPTTNVVIGFEASQNDPLVNPGVVFVSTMFGQWTDDIPTHYKNLLAPGTIVP